MSVYSRVCLSCCGIGEIESTSKYWVDIRRAILGQYISPKDNSFIVLERCNMQMKPIRPTFKRIDETNQFDIDFGLQEPVTFMYGVIDVEFSGGGGSLLTIHAFEVNHGGWNTAISTVDIEPSLPQRHRAAVRQLICFRASTEEPIVVEDLQILGYTSLVPFPGGLGITQLAMVLYS